MVTLKAGSPMDYKLLMVFISFGTGLVSCFPAVLLEYHYVNLSMSWPDAQRYCRASYTDLATIESMSDISRLNRPNKDTSLAWIGLNDDPLSWMGVMGNDVNSWRWSATGKTNAGGYQNWASGQPNDAGGNQFCVALNADGTWNDGYCTFSSSFVCYTGQNTYTVIADQKTWADALTYCRTYYTDLAMIENAQQNAEITAKVTSPSVWIGLYRVPWKWSDRSSSSFKNWQTGYPRNINGNNFCAAETSNHFWMDLTCSNKNPFWCHRVPPVMVIILRMKIQTDADLSDLANNTQLLQQLGAVLTKALPGDIQLTWKIQPMNQEETSTFRWFGIN